MKCVYFKGFAKLKKEIAQQRLATLKTPSLFGLV